MYFYIILHCTLHVQVAAYWQLKVCYTPLFKKSCYVLLLDAKSDVICRYKTCYLFLTKKCSIMDLKREPAVRTNHT